MEMRCAGILRNATWIQPRPISAIIFCNSAEAMLVGGIAHFLWLGTSFDV